MARKRYGALVRNAEVKTRLEGKTRLVVRKSRRGVQFVIDNEKPGIIRISETISGSSRNAVRNQLFDMINRC